MKFRSIVRVMIAVLIISTGCSKEYCESGHVISKNHSFDTVYPSEYFMLFPGSRWEYSDGTVDSCLNWQQMATHNSVVTDDCIQVDEDILILPKISSSSNFPVYRSVSYNQNVFTPSDFSSSSFLPIYSLDVGEFHYEGTNHDYHKRETLAHFDSLQVGVTTYYDVLHVRYLSYNYYPSINEVTQTIEVFFSKNVGLIKHSYLLNSNVYVDRELVNYHIGPH